jgi:hypothetical protein
LKNLKIENPNSMVLGILKAPLPQHNMAEDVMGDSEGKITWGNRKPEAILGSGLLLYNNLLLQELIQGSMRTTLFTSENIDPNDLINSH